MKKGVPYIVSDREQGAQASPSETGGDSVDYGDFLSIVRRLRKECPWDREQTHASTKPLLIEECYEAVEAIDHGDARDLEGELGDLLYLVFLNGVIAEETEEFGVEGIFGGAADKLIRRHPHVFGDTQAESEEEVKAGRERLKLRSEGRTSLLDGIPKHLPALLRAQKIQDKLGHTEGATPTAAESWLVADAALSSLQPGNEGRFQTGEIEETFGELLSALVNLSRAMGVDPEGSLNRASESVAAKVASTETALRPEGKGIADADAAELADLWRRPDRDDTGAA